MQQKKQRSKCRRLSDNQDLSVKSKKQTSNLKFESAAMDCCYEQTTIKKLKSVSPINIETQLGTISTQESAHPEDKLFCQEKEEACESFSLKMGCEFQEEEQVERLDEFMREQLSYDWEYNPNYLQNHPAIQAYMMHILKDWMIEVSHSFFFKRETYYIAINYLERYLSLKHNVGKELLQLIGVTSLLLAHKFEEIYPKRLMEFKKVTQDAYDENQIEQMEVEIMKVLQFKMSPNTPILWLNYYTKLWDDFIVDRIPEIQFRQKTNECYYRYRELVQLFDCCLMDYNFRYNSKLIILGLMYLMLGKHLSQFGDEQNISHSKQEFREYVEIKSEYNELFDQFLSISHIYIDYDTQIQFNQLYDVIADLTKYYQLPIDLTYPNALKIDSEIMFTQLTLEELLAFQTHNKNTLKLLDHRK